MVQKYVALDFDCGMPLLDGVWVVFQKFSWLNSVWGPQLERGKKILALVNFYFDGGEEFCIFTYEIEIHFIKSSFFFFFCKKKCSTYASIGPLSFCVKIKFLEILRNNFKKWLKLKKCKFINNRIQFLETNGPGACQVWHFSCSFRRKWL